jgi:RNA polymerase sigma-70 factor (ECF subfamily)
MDLRDPQQLRQVYEANSKGLYNLAYRLVGDRQWAEDILQETFVRAYTRADTFKQGGKVSTWMYRICMNLAYDHLRARRYRAMASLDVPMSDSGDSQAATWSATLASRIPDASMEVEEKDTEDCVRALIDELPERERTVVLLRQYHGMTFKDIASVLGLTSRTVQNCLRRAKSKLYFGLKEAGLAPADAEPSRDVQNGVPADL